MSDDQLDAARGVFWGVVFGLIIWVVLIEVCFR